MKDDWRVGSGVSFQICDWSSFISMTRSPIESNSVSTTSFPVSHKFVETVSENWNNLKSAHRRNWRIGPEN